MQMLRVCIPSWLWFTSGGETRGSCFLVCSDYLTVLRGLLRDAGYSQPSALEVNLHWDLSCRGLNNTACENFREKKNLSTIKRDLSSRDWISTKSKKANDGEKAKVRNLTLFKWTQNIFCWFINEKNKYLGAGHSSGIQHILSIHEALVSILSTTKQNKSPDLSEYETVNSQLVCVSLTPGYHFQNNPNLFRSTSLLILCP